VVLGALLATLLMVLTIGSRQPATSCAIGSPIPSAAIALLPEAGAYVSSIPRDAHQDILGVDGDTLWLVSPDSVARLDPDGGPDRQGAIGPAIAIPDRPTGTAPRPGGWWIPSPRPNTLAQFLPDEGTFGAWIQIELVPYRIAAAADALYVTDYEAGRLARVDPATGATLVDLDFPQAAAVAVTDEGTVLASSRDGVLRWLDPVTLATLGESRIAGSVMSFVADGARLIVQRNSRGQLTTLDPLAVGSGEQGSGARATVLAFAAGAVWASEWAADSQPAPLLRLDPVTLEPIARTLPPRQSAAESLAAAADQLWSAGLDGVSGAPVLYRIEPNPCLDP
jgi:hypothetical protein